MGRPGRTHRRRGRLRLSSRSICPRGWSSSHASAASTRMLPTSRRSPSQTASSTRLSRHGCCTTSRISSVASPRSHAFFGRVVRSSRSRTASATSTRCGISSAGISSLGGGRSGRRTASSICVATSSRFDVSTWWGRRGFLTQTRSVGTSDRPPSAGASSTASPTRRHLSCRRRSSACSRRPPRPLRRRVRVHAARHSGPACGRRQAGEQVADCNLLSCPPAGCVSAAAWARCTAGVVDQVEQIARRTSAEIDLEEDLRRHAAALASLTGGMDENTDLLVRRSCDPDALAITTGRSHDIGDDRGPRLEPPDETHDADIDDRSGPDHDRTLAEPLSRDRVAAEPGW